MNPTFNIQALTGTLGNMLVIPNSNIVFGVGSYFSRDTTSTTLNYVENTNNFLINNRYLIGNIGSENAEIITVNIVATGTNSSPSTATFSTIPINRHARGEQVILMQYDRIEIESSPTETGTYTNIATIDFTVKDNNTIFVHAAGISSTFYRIRFRNSITAFLSSYSLTQGTASMGVDTAGYLINSFKRTTGIENTDPVLTDSFFLAALNEARRIVDIEIGSGKMKEWRQQFEFPIKMLSGTNFVSLPTNIDYNETNRSLINARFSANSSGVPYPIMYVDKRRWNTTSMQRRYSTATAAVAISATSIVMANTGDFPARGTVIFQSENFTQNPMSITYTGNDKNINTLTGVVGVIRTIAINSQGWAFQTQSFPQTYTVFDNKLWFDSVIPVGLNGVNLYIDYYNKLVDIASMQTLIPEHYADIYKNYLRFAVKKRRDDTIGTKDEDYLRFIQAANNVFANDYIGQSILIK